MFNFERTEKSILIGAVLFLLLFSYFLYDDSLLFSKGNDSQSEMIGTVSNSLNDVRRKGNETFAWLPATKQDQVYQKDSVFTGEKSTAVIRLKDGTLIEIQPNSLVTLNIKDGQMSLDLRYGNMIGQVSKDSNLVVQSGGESFKLDGKAGNSSIEFSKSRSGNLDLNLISGSNNALKKGGQAVQLKPKAKPEIKLLSPLGKKLAQTKVEDEYNFTWSGKGDIARYEIQISADQNSFDKDIVSQFTRDQNIKLGDFEPGLYGWRVRGYDKANQLVVTSAVQNFMIAHLPPPQITSPVSQSQVNLYLKNPAQPPQLETKVTWESKEFAYPKYRVQISSQPDFSSNLKDVETVALESLTPALAKGSYYTRVRGIDVQNKLASEWSTPVAFNLDVLQPKNELQAPILVKKTISFKAPKREDRSPAALSAAPVFEWKPVMQAKKYKLQIAADKNFNSAKTYELSQTKSAWSQYQPGEYYYRVYSVDENENMSPASVIGKANIFTEDLFLNNIPAVKLRKSEEHPTPIPQNAKISWNEVPQAKSYQVELSSDKNFTQVQKFNFSSPNGEIQIPAPGAYQVRVKALNDQNKPISDNSNIQEVSYIFANALAAPKPREPFNQASIFLQQELTPFVWIEWKKVKGAANYRLEVSHSPDFSSPFVAKVTSESRFLIKEKMPLGKIYWRVRAEESSEANESEWSETREFTLYHKKNETFIQ